MTLEERLNSINTPKIKDVLNIGLLSDGKAETVKEFFDNFVEDRLPGENVIRKWHQLLKDYTKDLSKLSCCVRYGYQRGPKGGTPWGEVHDDALRRGWSTQNTTDEFEYFFTDNHFCTYICKMALCGFVPTLDEFTEAFRMHKFPYGFMYYLRNHPEFDGAVIEFGKNPGFSSNYKISHVFDAGAAFKVNDRSCSDAELSLLYYPLGCRDDFLKHSDCIRKMYISDEAKKVIVAKFLRLVHPFNYFLTPTTHPKLHVYDPAAAVKMNDIGEDPRMLYYMRNYLKGKYPDIYKEFLKMTLWPEDADIVYPDTSNEYIGMEYGPHLKGITTTSTKIPKPVVKKNPVDFDQINNRAYLEGFNVGEIANYILRAIIERGVSNGKITKADIEAFKTEKGSKISRFKISKPLLASQRKDDRGYFRYYENSILCYGEELYLYKDWDKNNIKIKENLIQWILDWIDAHGGSI